MRSLLLAAAAALGLLMAQPAPTLAQGAAPDTSTAPTKRSRAARPKREPTAGQMAARERQRKCGAEWKEAKAKGTTGGLRWPQYYSKCNTRLKGNQA